MNKMFKLALLIFLLFSGQVYATLLLELEDDSDGNPTISVGYNKGAANFDIGLYVDTLSTNSGSSATDPIVVYVPVTDGTINKLNFIKADSSAGNDDYDLANISIKLTFLATTENETDDEFTVYGGLYESDTDTSLEIFNYDTTYSTSGTISKGLTDRQVSFIFSLQDLCNEHTASPCDNLSTDNYATELRAYLYLKEKGSVTLTDTIGTGGLHFKFVISNINNDGVTTKFLNNEAEPGDNRLYTDISSTAEYSYPLDTYLLVDSAGSSISAGTFGATVTSGGTTQVADVLPYTPNGEIAYKYIDQANPLVNDTTYCLSLIQVNKFYLSNLVADGICGTPKDIETLLKEKQCYLLTAGFGRDHKVINFFRDFRDNVLLNYSLGKSFVEFYYNTAPNYTSYIHSSPRLSLFIRSFAWIAYYFIKFQYFIYGILSILILGKAYLTLSKRRTKVS
ncbi:MAG: hypothetical protein H6622_12040 [Halobacteriovoraceae bacterium]|nr:hypothetical protein [Halobacteriovoraceae bacterium]